MNIRYTNECECELSSEGKIDRKKRVGEVHTKHALFLHVLLDHVAVEERL